MFLDASAIVALISDEPEAELLAEKLTTPARLFVSPMAIWEATIALAREGKGFTFDEAQNHVDAFVARLRVQIIPVTAEIGTLAVEASRLYGRGRHKADLNFGDCFAYACARVHRVPLLFKGDDFIHTDIEAAYRPRARASYACVSRASRLSPSDGLLYKVGTSVTRAAPGRTLRSERSPSCASSSSGPTS